MRKQSFFNDRSLHFTAMLDDLDRTLRDLLIEEMPLVVERIEPDGFDIEFDVPNREFTSRLTRPTLNLYLFNIQENRERGRGPWTMERSNGAGTTSRPPVRLDCSYMATAWSNEIEDEHRLLTGAARVFFRNPFLTEEMLQGSIPTDLEIRTEVAQPAAMKDVIDLWSVLDNDLKPSIRITVTVPLELGMSEESGLVNDRGIEMPPPSGGFGLARSYRIEGRVTRAGQPVAGARIRIDRSSATSRDDGSFELRQVTPGTKAVLIYDDGEWIDLETQVPSEDGWEIELPTGEEATADKKN